MSLYISSNDNRLYVGPELAYGQAPPPAALSRLPLIGLAAKQNAEIPPRQDKTGSRTYSGTPTGVRKLTSYALQTPLSTWEASNLQPSYGPLFQAAMGASPRSYEGGALASTSGTRLTFQSSHGLHSGQSLIHGGEIRFVAAIVDAQTVEINAPFAAPLGAGTPIERSITYPLGNDLGSCSLFEYWQDGAIHRLLTGVAVDELLISVNADWHQFEFRGPAKDIYDSHTFADGEAGLAEFPAEPALSSLDGVVVPGHIGQAWIGTNPDRMFSVVSASVRISNSLQTRAREFGSSALRCVSGGRRAVEVDFEVYASEDASTKGLYQAAREGSPIQVMFQLGEQPGQLFGLFMKSVRLELPEFNDSEDRLLWKFTGGRAQGNADDEMYAAFG